jgi:tetratricopeptide (TPR) repeat protein
MGCELRASLPGYRSEMVNLAGRRVLDNPDVGTIVLRRVAGAEGTVVSAASLAAPKDARKAYDKGREAGRKDKWEEAQRQFQKAVDVYPKYADAWYELGRCHQHAGNAPEARKAYGQALALDAKYMKPYLALSMLSAQENNWAEAADLSGKALKLDPVSYPEAYYLNAVANLRLNHLPQAENAARQGSQADTAHRVPKLNYLLGMLLADKKEYPAAAEQIRLYLQFAPKAIDAEQVRKQLTEIEQFATAAAPAPRP